MVAGRCIRIATEELAMADSIELNCPCCEALLVVDRDSGQVLFHRQKEKKTKLSLEAMVNDLGNQKSEAAKRFEREIESQKDRGKVLEDKFQEALRRADKSDTPFRNPLDYD